MAGPEERLGVGEGDRLAESDGVGLADRLGAGDKMRVAAEGVGVGVVTGRSAPSDL